MISYADWRRKSINVATLRLDSANPRIPDSGRILSQAELVAELIEHDDVYDLARGIVKNGYFPLESLIVVKEDDQWVVVEGNRRIAALKCLLKPKIAPDEFVNKFTSLSRQIARSTIKKVLCIVAPSRKYAAPIVASKHTERTTLQWKPLMKSKFYRSLVDAGQTVEEIAKQHNTTVGEVYKALQRCDLYRIACSLDLPGRVLEIVRDPRQFPITSFERVVSTKVALEFLGLEFDETKNLHGKIKKDEFAKGFGKIVTDIALETKNSRKLNDVPAITEYIKKIPPSETPNLKKKGRFTVKDFDVSSDSKQIKTNEKPTRIKKKSQAQPKSVMPATLTCEVSNQRIVGIFSELKKLAVSQYPNATAIMFRSLVEMALARHLKNQGHMADCVSNCQKKAGKKAGKKPKDWQPSLKQMLSYVVNPHTPSVIADPSAISVINHLISKNDDLIAIDAMNLFVHNEHYLPVDTELRKMANDLVPLLEVVLVDP